MKAGVSRRYSLDLGEHDLSECLSGFISTSIGHWQP
jgi:hypothetical protein